MNSAEENQNHAYFRLSKQLAQTTLRLQRTQIPSMRNGFFDQSYSAGWYSNEETYMHELILLMIAE